MEDGLRQRVVLVMGHYYLCLPHDSLREPMVKAVPTTGNGSPKVWRVRTPTIAAA